jgi:hypothetical protein
MENNPNVWNHQADNGTTVYFEDFDHKTDGVPLISR